MTLAPPASDGVCMYVCVCVGVRVCICACVCYVCDVDLAPFHLRMDLGLYNKVAEPRGLPSVYPPSRPPLLQLHNETHF